MKSSRAVRTVGGGTYVARVDAPQAISGACQVWWAKPSQAQLWHDELLSPAERRRREGMARPLDRERFTVGSALLRTIVGGLTGVPAEEVSVDRSCPDCGEPHGKPVLEPENLHCSVSHSGERIVVAVARDVLIGVDVEKVEPCDNLDSVASYVLTNDELESFRRVPASEQLEVFYTYWTRKEAILKATGHGLRVEPNRIAVSSPFFPPPVDGVEDVLCVPMEVTLHDLNPGPGYKASLAVVGSGLTRVTELDAARVLERRGGAD